MREPSSRRPAGTVAGGRSNARIEESITRLESVAVCNLVTGHDGRLESLDVVGAPGWPLETVRRDVQAVLFHNFDLDVPATLTAVRGPDSAPASARPQTAGAPAGAEGTTGTATQTAPAGTGTATIDRERLVLDTVHLALRAHGTSVGVDLLDGEQRLRGTAGPVGPTGVLTGVVEATIDALGDRISHGLSPVVAEVVEVGGDQIAIATVTASDGRNRQRLNGSAIVRGNIEDAMARATLDATNRLVEG